MHTVSLLLLTGLGFHMHLIVAFLSKKQSSKRLTCDIRNQDLRRQKRERKVWWRYLVVGQNLRTGLCEVLVTELRQRGFYSYSSLHVSKRVATFLTCLHLVGETLQQIDGI